MKPDRLQFPFHPLLIASYPVLALIAVNLGEVLLAAGLRLWIGCLVFGALVVLAFWIVMRRWQPAALAATIVILLALSYGHLYGILEHIRIGGVLVGRHRYLIPLSVLICIGGILLSRRRQSLPTLTSFFNAVAIILIILPVFQIARFYIGIAGASSQGDNLAHQTAITADSTLPDIYYLILDEYPRADVLAAAYDFDNQPFISALEAEGFFVAANSQSNYAQTELSLASSLNFNYLSELIPDLDPASEDRTALWSLIKHSAIMTLLEANGYTSVAFETGYSWSQIENADLYLGPSQGVGNTSAWGLTDFEVLFLRETALLALYDARLALPDFLTPELERPARRAYERTELALEEIGNIPAMEGLHFVFAHLLVPHPPYVYGGDGEYIGDEYGPDGQWGDEDALYVHNIEGHRRSVAYINDRLLSLTAEIISGSDVPPVIILQADHGVPFSTHADRMNIFNAYYLPGEGASSLYPAISPVNSFRIVLNTYFSAGLPLLEDASFFSGYDQPYNFQVVE